MIVIRRLALVVSIVLALAFWLGTPAQPEPLRVAVGIAATFSLVALMCQEAGL